MAVIHFKNKKGIIFIHIPKTGGSSINNYFKNKYNFTDNEMCLGDNHIITHSLFHTTWKEYCKYWDILYGVVFNEPETRDISKYKVFTVVRNPYTRLISDFYWWMVSYEVDYNNGKKKIENMPPDIITIEYMEKFLENMLNDFINKDVDTINGSKYDTHVWPQHYFLEDIEKERITILKQETLTEQMKKQELFSDFSRLDNSYPKKISYDKLLTPKIISLVNSVYYNDFILFDYKMLNPEIDGIMLSKDFVVRTRDKPLF